MPKELYEAAKIDGATAWQRFWYVTLPGIRYTMVMVTLLSSIWTANGFENVWLLTQGGPSDATMVFPVLAYFGMQTQRIGEAAAVSVAMPARVWPSLVFDPDASSCCARTRQGRPGRDARLNVRDAWRMMVLAVLLVCPIYWMIAISLKTAARHLPRALAVPDALTLDNYHVLLSDKQLPGQ